MFGIVIVEVVGAYGVDLVNSIVLMYRTWGFCLYLCLKADIVKSL